MIEILNPSVNHQYLTLLTILTAAATMISLPSAAALLLWAGVSRDPVVFGIVCFALAGTLVMAAKRAPPPANKSSKRTKKSDSTDLALRPRGTTPVKLALAT